MNFDLNEEQQVVSDLAAQLFGDLATTERVKAVEDEGSFDVDLWTELAAAGLVGLCLPESHDGSGMGTLELSLIAEQQGRNVAQVPLTHTVSAAMAIGEFGSDELKAATLPRVAEGSLILTAALAEPGANRVLEPSVSLRANGDHYVLTGSKPAVPYAVEADHILISATDESGLPAIAVVDTTADGVLAEPVDTTSHEPQAHLTIDTKVDAAWVMSEERCLDWLRQRHLAVQCAVLTGVAGGSVTLTAEHVSTRQQFGRPLSAFQAVSQRAADGYIYTEAMRTTMLNAAWRLDADLDATSDVLVAAYWASEGAQIVVLGSQHLHGGVGSDVDHPVHRHLLWGMQLAHSLGTATSHLADLGELISLGKA